MSVVMLLAFDVDRVLVTKFDSNGCIECCCGNISTVKNTNRD